MSVINRIITIDLFFTSYFSKYKYKNPNYYKKIYFNEDLIYKILEKKMLLKWEKLEQFKLKMYQRN